MRIAIIGATGMLGSSVYKTLKDKCDLVLTARSQEKFDKLEEVHGGIRHHTGIIFDAVNYDTPSSIHVASLARRIGPVDLAINCIGVLNKFAPGKTPSVREYYMINMALPIQLSWLFRSKLIHPSTDCVFDGTSAPYSESSSPSPSYGIYGYAKLIADEEVRARSLVLRCCLIGEELYDDAFQMFAWIKRQKRAGGYTHWFISPITGVEFGKVCWRIATQNFIYPEGGLVHLATPQLSKYEILEKYIEVRQLDVQLWADASKQADKTLITEHPDMVKALQIAPFEQMMEEL